MNTIQKKIDDEKSKMVQIEEEVNKMNKLMQEGQQRLQQLALEYEKARARIEAWNATNASDFEEIKEEAKK